MRLRTGRAARRFAHALDAPTRHGASRQDADTRELVGLAQQLQTTKIDIAPTTEFKDRLRQRLIAVGTVAADAPATPKPREPLTERIQTTRHRSHHKLAFAAGALTSLILVGGLAVIESGRALPGDMLYGLKRTTESVQLSLAGSDAAASREHLSIAHTRLSEVQDLIGRGSAAGAIGNIASGGTLNQHESKLVQGTLADMDRQTVKGAKLATTAAVKSGNRSKLADLISWAHKQRTGVQSVHSIIDGPAGARAGKSVQLLTDVLDRARALQAETEHSCSVTTDALGPLPCTAGQNGVTTPTGTSVADSQTSATAGTSAASSAAGAATGSSTSPSQTPSAERGSTTDQPSTNASGSGGPSDSPSQSSQSPSSSPTPSGTPTPSGDGPTGALPSGILPPTNGLLPTWLLPGLLPPNLLPIGH